MKTARTYFADESEALQEFSYDAWGNSRDPYTWRGTTTTHCMFDRGFTGHEMLYDFGLINMNGRMYDPVMSSFLSVDRYVQNPSNSQNFNRYSYCLNNPLKYTDPSGWQMIGGNMPKPFSWGFGSNVVYEPRDLGLRQLPEENIGICFPEDPEKSGGGPAFNGCWYINSDGNLDYVFGVSTQAELDEYGPEYGVYGTVIGPSFKDENYYYSILGYKVDLNEENGLAAEIAQKIDDALVKYAEFGWRIAIDGNSIQEYTNFSSEKAPFQTDIFGLSYNSIRTFNVGPAQCHYIIFNNAAAMQAKLDHIPTGDVANSSNGRGTQQEWINGVELQFVNSITTSQMSNYTVSLVFPLQSYKKGFLSRYNCFWL